MSSQAIIDDDLDEMEAREGRLEPIGVPRAFNATAPAFNPLVSPTGTGVSPVSYTHLTLPTKRIV